MVERVDIDIGDTVKMKKKHPCGANQWEVYKLGVVIGLECQGCGRKINLPRQMFNHKFRGYIKRTNAEMEAN